MNRLIAYGITASALKALLSGHASLASVPSGWFNWVGDRGEKINAHNVQRLELLRGADVDDSIASWSQNASAAGYECFLISSTDDRLSAAALRTLPEDVIHYIIAPVLSPEDPHEYDNLLQLLREPESELHDGWADLRRGGGSTLEAWNATPSQWWAYAEALSEWMRRTAGDSEAALVLRHTGLDFSTWRWTQHLDPTLLDLDCWLSRDRPWTKAEIPALERYGYVAFYPMRQMPCCGIAIDTRGSLHTIGSLPTEDGQWLWDDGTIRAAFEALTLPKPKPLQSRLEKLLASAQSFFGEVVSVMRGDVASGVLHASDGNRPPYRFDLGDGEYISVEINDQDRTVTITPNLGDPRPYFLFWVDANGEGSVAANEAMSAWAEIKTRDDEFECPKDIPLDSLEPIIVVRPVSVD